MDAVADILSPGNAAALIGLAFLALAALPLLLALRYGFRVAVLAALIWGGIGWVAFSATDALGMVDGLGVGIFVFTLPWLIVALGGALLRRGTSARRRRPV
jgi:hypothetical protein